MKAYGLSYMRTRRTLIHTHVHSYLQSYRRKRGIMRNCTKEISVVGVLYSCYKPRCLKTAKNIPTPGSSLCELCTGSSFFQAITSHIFLVILRHIPRGGHPFATRAHHSTTNTILYWLAIENTTRMTYSKHCPCCLLTRTV